MFSILTKKINDHKSALWEKNILKDRVQDIKEDKQNKEIRYNLTDLEKTTRMKNKIINKAKMKQYHEGHGGSLLKVLQNKIN